MNNVSFTKKTRRLLLVISGLILAQPPDAQSTPVAEKTVSTATVKSTRPTKSSNNNTSLTSPLRQQQQNNDKKLSLILPIVTQNSTNGKIILVPLPDNDSSVSLDMEMLPVPAGAFQMGDNTKVEQKNAFGETIRTVWKWVDEIPHKVTISKSFWLGKTEVTQEQWHSIMGNNPSKYKGRKLPVENISWHDAVLFCKKLTEREQQAGRLPENYEYALPTEAQWEYACRAGTTSDYAGTNNLDDMGWYGWNMPENFSGGIGGGGNSQDRTHEVAQKKANDWGFHDMHGNVEEFCADWYDSEYYNYSPNMDPINMNKGLFVVTRGGSFGTSKGAKQRSSARGEIDPNRSSPSCGFRVALRPVILHSKTFRSNTADEKFPAPKSTRSKIVLQLNETVSLELLPVDTGKFKMGDGRGYAAERPVHEVVITKPFWLGKTEVTQAQWEAVMGNNPAHFKGMNLPVENVSWEDAVLFCMKLTKKERDAKRLPDNYEYTLPSEAQWEYACRAGTTTSFNTGNLLLAEQANFGSNKTKPVGNYEPNAWGFYDMHGNVGEWCYDLCDISYYGATSAYYKNSPLKDPMGTTEKGWRSRSVRGGSWNEKSSECRSASRGGAVRTGMFPSSDLHPSERRDSRGFRLALAPISTNKDTGGIRAIEVEP